MEKLLKEITDDIYYLPASEETDRPILALIEGEKSSLLVDAGNSEKHAELFLEAVKKKGLREPDYLAITHWHWDHVFGIKRLGIPTFSHLKTKKKVEEMVTLDWTDQALDQRVAEGTEISFCCEMIKAELPIRDNLELAAPDISFTDKLIIDLGGIHCVIEHVGGDHSEDSCVVYVPERKTLFLGDCLCPDIYSGNWSYSMDKLMTLLDKLESYDVEYYVESHAQPVTFEEMVSEFIMLRCMGNLVMKYGDDLEGMTREFESKFQRSFSEDELSVIKSFIAGLSK